MIFSAKTKAKINLIINDTILNLETERIIKHLFYMMFHSIVNVIVIIAHLLNNCYVE